MDPKLINKKVGQVQIFEISGDFQGNVVPQAQAAIYQILNVSRSKSLFFNFEKLFQIDLYGARIIVQTAGLAKRCCALVRDPLTSEILSQEDTQHKVVCVKAIEDAVRHFSHEFVGEDSELHLVEQRKFKRLQTALPLRFTAEGVGAPGQTFFAIVTNLSEGGLFADFIQSVHEETLLCKTDPLDVNKLKLRLWLDSREPLELGGKFIHAQSGNHGFGIEFSDMPDHARRHISDWLNEKTLVEKLNQNSKGES